MMLNYIEDKKTKVKFKFKFQVDKFCCCWQQFPMRKRSWPLSLNLRISFGLKQTSLIDVWWWVCVGVRLEQPMRGQEQHLPANQKSPHESCIGESRDKIRERRLIGLSVIGMRPITMKMRGVQKLQKSINSQEAEKSAPTRKDRNSAND